MKNTQTGDVVTLEDLAAEDRERAAEVTRRKINRRWRRGER